jgi:TM2 domain-containing membrane protein YozV
VATKSSLSRSWTRRNIHRTAGRTRALQRVAVLDVYLIREVVQSKEKPMRSPILAAVLSLIIAGLGQIYNGQVTKGVIFIVVQLINGALTAVLIGWFLLPLVGLWAMIDAYMTAKHNNERYSFR